MTGQEKGDILMQVAA